MNADEPETTTQDSSGATRGEAMSSAEADPPAPAGGAGAAVSPAELEDLRKRAEEREAYRAELLRARADFENYQKRVRKDRPGWEEQAVRRFLRDLLPVCDNLERAISHTLGAEPAPIEEGVRLTFQLLRQVLADHGVEEIPAAGLPFDPQLHEAVGHVPTEQGGEGRVAEVLEKGYRHRDAVLRPTKVLVGVGPAVQPRQGGSQGDNGSPESGGVEPRSL